MIYVIVKENKKDAKNAEVLLYHQFCCTGGGDDAENILMLKISAPETKGEEMG